jgi:UPF0716 family protein affecting phage T7 exclusion
VIPGFVTDVLGVLLLLPPVQYWLRATLRRAMTGSAAEATPPGVVDLAPDQWERVPDAQIPDHRARRSPPRSGD